MLNLKGLSQPVFSARTGYTGEDGAELLLNANDGQKLWQLLLDRGVTPCGLGARDTLRLEAAMHLYGQDMTTTQPTPSRRDWAGSCTWKCPWILWAGRHWSKRRNQDPPNAWWA